MVRYIYDFNYQDSVLDWRKKDFKEYYENPVIFDMMKDEESGKVSILIPTFEEGDIELGCRFWMDITPMNIAHSWKKCTCTFVRSGIIFYKVGGRNPELYMEDGCYFFKNIYPVKVLVNTDPSKIEFTCNCPHVKIINYWKDE